MAIDPPLPVLVLYGRRYCHLCDDMAAALRELQDDLDFVLRMEDVDSDPELEGRYGERVPVLVGAGHELCHYHLDEAAVVAWLRGAQVPAR